MAAEKVITLIVQIKRQGARPAGRAGRHRCGGCQGAGLQSERVALYLEGKEPRKVIYVPGRLVNIVA